MQSQFPLQSNDQNFQSKTDATPLKPRIVCVLPCYNVAASCGEILKKILLRVEHVIAINDGSTDETETILNSIASKSDCRVSVFSFPQNRGKGAALIEGFRHALGRPFDLLVTIDADGQHEPSDIDRLATLWIETRPDLMIGERLELAAMPMRSRFGNWLTSRILNVFFPGCPRDTQSGLRALNYQFVSEVVDSIRPQRYETELRILLLALAQRRQIGSVAIKTIYFDGNRQSHFRPIRDSARIYAVIIPAICRSVFHVIFSPQRRKNTVELRSK
jgi:glycosyltransferase involved in cell wall biosynthesis